MYPCIHSLPLLFLLLFGFTYSLSFTVLDSPYLDGLSILFAWFSSSVFYHWKIVSRRKGGGGGESVKVSLFPPLFDS